MGACLKCCYDPDAQIAASYSFLVERDASSLNARLFNGAQGWKYRRERDTWQSELRVARVNARVPIGDTKRRVTLTRLYGGRQQERDRDNLAGGMKCVVDALVLERLIVDDSSKWAEIHYAQRRIAKGEKTGVLFEIEVLL